MTFKAPDSRKLGAMPGRPMAPPPSRRGIIAGRDEGDTSETTTVAAERI
jgi:hypothetical protein